MYIVAGYDRIGIESSGSINPANRINTDAEICVDDNNGRVYLFNTTNRYWHNSARGNVVELRNIKGEKIRDGGTKEITNWGTPQYWDYLKHEDPERKVPEKVKTFYFKLKKYWKDRRRY